jgi:chromosome segregation ATPase
MKEASSPLALTAPAPDLELPIREQPTARAELEDKWEQTREELIELHRRQEELERQKGELEELRRKQEEYTRGRVEMLDHLTRSLITLEREQVEALRLAELCGKTMTAFRDYKERIEAIRDEDWTSANLRAELTRALAVIHDARLEYNRARTRLDCLNPAAQPAAAPVPTGPQPVAEQREILRYLLLGAAATAPLILAGTVWLIVLVALR